MTTPLTFKNFCTEFVIKPFDKRLSAEDQKKALKYSIITGICLVALLHITALTYQIVGKLFFKVTPPIKVEENKEEHLSPRSSQTSLSSVASSVISASHSASPTLSPSTSSADLKIQNAPVPPSSPPTPELLQPTKSTVTIPDREVALQMLIEATEGDEIYKVLTTPIDAPHDPLQNSGIPLTFWDLMNHKEFKEVLIQKIPELTSQQAYYILSEKQHSTHFPSTFFYKHNKLTEVVCFLLEQLTLENLKALFALPCSADPKNTLFRQVSVERYSNYFKPLLLKHGTTEYVEMLKRSIRENQRADPEYRRALFNGNLKIV